MTEPGHESADARRRCGPPEAQARISHGGAGPQPAGGRKHGHDHGHSHGSRLTLTGQHRKSLVIVMPITLSVALAEAIGAWFSRALVLLAAAAVIVTGLVIELTGFTRADPIASLLVGALILPRTWRLLADAIDVLLEASPRGIDLSEVRRHLVGLPGVSDVHDLHAWTITSGLPVISVHVVVEPQVLADGTSAHMLDVLQECLSGHFDVEHSTFQLERAGHADPEQPIHE